MLLLLDSRVVFRPTIWEIVVDLLLSLPFLLVDLLADFTYRAIPFIFTILVVLAVLFLLLASIYAAWRLVGTSIQVLNSIVGLGTIVVLQVNARNERKNKERAERSIPSESKTECCTEETGPCEGFCCCPEMNTDKSGH